MKRLSEVLMLMAAALPSFCAAADDVDRAATEIVMQPDKDAQCGTFFRHFDKYLSDQEFGKADELMARVDAKRPGIVPYCNTMKGNYSYPYQ